MFVPIHSVIEAGLLQDGVWVHEDDDSDPEGTKNEGAGAER